MDALSTGRARRGKVCLMVADLLLLAAACRQATAPATSPHDRGDGWTTAEPSDVGLDGQALVRMTQSILSGDWGHIHALLIERRGKLAYEAYFAGPDQRWGRDLGTVEPDADRLHDLRSVSKTVTSTLVGIALGRGEIDSVDTPIVDLLPERSEALSGAKRAITLRHLLTMSSGLEWDESLPYSDPRNDERRLIDSEDPVGFVLGRQLVHEPGSTWTYSGGSTHLLGAILERRTGRPLAEYAAEVLFGPLAIVETEWLGNLAGIPAAASGLRMRPRDLAKIGSLFLHQGRWNGTQVVPPAWVEAALKAQAETPDPETPSFVLLAGYGYQWWINSFDTSLGPLDVMAAVGNGGQRLILVPELDLAVTLLSGDYNDPRHFWTPERLLIRHIIPAVLAREGISSKQALRTRLPNDRPPGPACAVLG